MVLYFYLKARYSVPIIGLYLDLGARYLVFLNTVLNFDLRADIRYTDEFGAELYIWYLPYMVLNFDPRA